jgi:LmbE family N-acetylglucosaminyl deacetylase
MEFSIMHRNLRRALASLMLIVAWSSRGASVSIEGAPSDSGYNAGTMATIEATLRGVAGDPSRYAVFADIRYWGTTAVTSVQLDRKRKGNSGELYYTGDWPIPWDAPTGIYGVTVRAEDRTSRREVARKQVRAFAAYRKLVRIARLELDKTFYSVGEPIECEVTLENLTSRDLKGLRVEFSIANYPWISTLSAEASLSGQHGENPELALVVLRDHLDLAANEPVTLPMMRAGTAAFLQGTQVTVLGAGGPARHAQNPPPEVDFYTLAVWNQDRTVLYDMQFSPPAIIRPLGIDLPKPYSNLTYTHRYNSDIDFSKYREFYSPEQISPALATDHAHTLFRPGDAVLVKASLKNPGEDAWRSLELRAQVMDSTGVKLHEATLRSEIDLGPGESSRVEAKAWNVPDSLPSGNYRMKLALVRNQGRPVAETTEEIAFNKLPGSLLVFVPHEDDEHSYAGLIRAALEAGIPVRVVVFTGGDVGECERYYSKPCGPNEAREFGMVRMEETREALEHLGLARDQVSILGLPDGGSGEIWFHHIKVSNPYLSIYLATDHAPYENVLKPNLTFARDAVVGMVKQVIEDFKPAMIATAHPDERHVDHRTANWFVIKACQELWREKKLDPNTIILADQAYGAGGYKPAPYQYEKWPVYLSGEAAALKQEMSWIYQSQDGNIDEGMKKNFSELLRQELHYRILDWQEHEGWNE